MDHAHACSDATYSTGDHQWYNSHANMDVIYIT